MNEKMEKAGYSLIYGGALNGCWEKGGRYFRGGTEKDLVEVGEDGVALAKQPKAARGGKAADAKPEEPVLTPPPTQTDEAKMVEDLVATKTAAELRELLGKVKDALDDAKAKHDIEIADGDEDVAKRVNAEQIAKYAEA